MSWRLMRKGLVSRDNGGERYGCSSQDDLYERYTLSACLDALSLVAVFFSFREQFLVP